MQPNLRIVPSRADYQAYLEWEKVNRSEVTMEQKYGQFEADREQDELRSAFARKERKNTAIGCAIFAGLAVFSVLPWLVGVVEMAKWAWQWIGGGR